MSFHKYKGENMKKIKKKSFKAEKKSKEYLLLVAKGYKYKDISRITGMSKYYINICRKYLCNLFGAKTRAQLVYIGLKTKFIIYK